MHTNNALIGNLKRSRRRAIFASKSFGNPLSAMLNSGLPRFRKPPVVETVLGLMFDPLPKLSINELSLFWGQLGECWKKCTIAPHLSPQYERFDAKQIFVEERQQLLMQVIDSPTFRLQIEHESKSRMIQVQNSRFHYNWIGTYGDSYPSFQSVKPDFESQLAKFVKFVDDRQLGVVKPEQWEITYVNVMSKGTVWHEPSDWNHLFPKIPAPMSSSSVAELESFEGEWHYIIPERKGRLHVQIKHQKQLGNKEESIRMVLTARGPINENTDRLNAMNEGLNIGHDVIVQSFFDLTSSIAHEVWESY